IIQRDVLDISAESYNMKISLQPNVAETFDRGATGRLKSKLAQYGVPDATGEVGADGKIIVVLKTKHMQPERQDDLSDDRNETHEDAYRDLIDAAEKAVEVICEFPASIEKRKHKGFGGGGNKSDSGA
ncbi:MAG TPA: hypothetical protein VLG38_06040, partial [Gammaproteobacteria bacterium]|nr:hypothetical protein [Gammaproteobacteria bacterium]